METAPRAPLQARSRRTMEDLLRATLAVIEERGLSGVTIPAVASAAGVSTGSVYRRFENKEAMIRAAFVRLLELSQETNRANLPADRLRGFQLADALLAVSRGLVAQYRGRIGLMKALDQYLEGPADEAFRARAVDLIAGNVRLLVGALRPFREAISPTDPERAVSFALLSAMTLVEANKLHASPIWSRVLPLDDEALASEVARVMAAYLTTP